MISFLRRLFGDPTPMLTSSAASTLAKHGADKRRKEGRALAYARLEELRAGPVRELAPRDVIAKLGKRDLIERRARG